MDCDQARPMLSDYLEGSPVRRAELEAHLAGCVACAAELAALRRVDDLLAAAPWAEPPSGLWEGVEARLEERSARRPRLVWAGAFAAAALLLAVLWPRPTPPEEVYSHDLYRVTCAPAFGDGLLGDVMPSLRGEAP